MLFTRLQFAAVIAAGSLLAAVPALAADTGQAKPEASGSAVVTVLSGNEIPGGIPQQALRLKVDGKNSTVTGWTPLRGPQSAVEIVILIDNGARESLGLQMKDITKFIQGLPPNAMVAIAYMQNGKAMLAGPLSANHAAVAKQLHLPMAEVDASASPYFCLSDLAKHWPSNDTHARREVIMVTDGVDYYNPRYDPDDPYLQAAIQDAVRAHLVVYSIYWTNSGYFARTDYAAFTGQSLLGLVTGATGGNSYWEGYGNPVSFEPFFADIDKRLENQYELDFITPVGGKPQMASMKLKLDAPAKVDAPQQVFVHPGAE